MSSGSDLLWGILTFIGFAMFCIASDAGRIPIDLGMKSEAELTGAGMNYAQVDFSGRDAVLEGIAPDDAARARAEELVVGVWGVRQVDNRMTIAAQAPAVDREEIQRDIDALLSSQVIEFESGSDRLTAAGRSTVEEAARILQRAPQARAAIGGHTDSQGAEDSNLDLSRRRAATVLRVLVGAGIPEERLRSEGYGETRPIADNSTASGRLQNRRVEIELE